MLVVSDVSGKCIIDNKWEALRKTSLDTKRAVEENKEACKGSKEPKVQSCDIDFVSEYDGTDCEGNDNDDKDTTFEISVRWTYPNRY